MIEDSRINEWFVPKFGPFRFRVFIGLLFLPYTGMCIAFTIIGSMLAENIAWDRVAAIAVIYGLALGMSAHAADTLGSKKTKPWGKYFSKKELLILSIAPLVIAYLIGAYYIAFYVPYLLIIAILEGFFLFAYNFELFGGIFHNNTSFALSWGVLPVLAGFIMQTNSVNLPVMAVSALAGLVSFLEIRTSRPYKDLKRDGNVDPIAKKLENRLKIMSMGTIIFSLCFLVYRLVFQ